MASSHHACHGKLLLKHEQPITTPAEEVTEAEADTQEAVQEAEKAKAEADAVAGETGNPVPSEAAGATAEQPEAPASAPERGVDGAADLVHGPPLCLRGEESFLRDFSVNSVAQW